MCLVTFSWEKVDAVKKIKEFERMKIPTWGNVEITEKCNYNCIWCYAKQHVKSERPREMSKENLFKVIDILHNSGIKQITFTGGEPLMHPYLLEAIEYTHSKGIISHLNTNGYFLSVEIAEELSERGLTQVLINIDALNKKEHDSIRGKKEAFNKAMQAFENALNTGITCVSQTVLTTYNVDIVCDIIKLARSLGIQRCRVGDITLSGGAVENKYLIPYNFINVLEKVTKFADKMGAKSIISYEPLFPLNTFETSLKIIHKPCSNGMGISLNVFADGGVYYCVALRKKQLYNIFDYENIAEVHMKKIQEYKSSFKFSTTCTQCENFKICKGGCPVRRNYNNIDYQCSNHLINV